MPRIQYVQVNDNIRITKDMPTPKKVSSIDAWLKAAIKVIPEIPNPYRECAYLMHHEANTDFLRFEIHTGPGIKHHVVILRHVAKGLGGMAA